jgi:hypothetical protein
MALDKKTLPVPSWKGLYLDGVTIPGGMSKAENIFILPDGSAQRRNYERTLAESNVTVAGHGLKNVYELRKSDSSRYIFADLDNAGTSIASFGAELVTGASAFSGWTDVADWSYGSTKWTHAGTGTTTLTGKPTVTAAATYRIVVDVTCPLPSTAAGGWTYANTDSGQTWTSSSGQSHVVWAQSWTHAASGGTTALNAIKDFIPVIGQSYRIRVNATLGATNAGTCDVYLGGVLAGTISGSNTTTYFDFVARFVTDATGLRFVPTTDFAGSINKAYPYVPSKLDEFTSVKKLINPNGATNAANLGDELLKAWSSSWYPEVSSQVSQSCTVKIGAATAGVITESGIYTYTTTATDTTAIQFIPTTAWGGSIDSCSIQAVTYAASTTEMKVIGGLVTGTTDYEVSWANILTNLTTGNTVQPSWATMQDRAFRVDGTNLNYWFKDAAGYHLLGVGAPVEPPTVASTTGGELTAGSYNVYYTYVKKDGLYVAEGNPSPVAFVEVAGTAITVSVVTLTDPDVTHIRIYRTLYNEPGADAYLDSEISNETQTVTLTQPDDVIRDLNSILEFDHDVPPQAKFVLTAGSRLWFVNLPNEVGGKSTIKWSILDFPEAVPALNYQTFDPNDGDELVGACPLSSNLLVFKRRRTWLCDIFSAQVVDGVAALSKHIISPNLGCIASGSIQAVGLDSAMWLSSEGVILYSGGELKNVSKDRINSIIFGFINNGAEPFIDSVYLPLRRLYHINFLYRNSGNNTIVSQRHFVYSLDSDAWTEYVYTSSTGTRHYELNFCLATDSNQRDVILVPYMVDTTGEITYVYQSDYDATNHTDTDLVLMSCFNSDIFSYRKTIDQFMTIDESNTTSEIFPIICDCGSGVIIGGANYDRGGVSIYKSEDYGNTYVAVNETHGEVKCLVYLGLDIVLAGVNADTGYEIWKSEDSGDAWSVISWSFGSYEPVAFCDAGGGVVVLTALVGGVFKMLRSSNYGETWAEVSSAFFTSLAAASVCVPHDSGSGVIIAAGSDSTSATGYRLLKSTNYGVTWANTGIDTGPGPIADCGENVLLCGGYRSTDGGAAWSAIATLSGLFSGSDDHPRIYTDLGNGYTLLACGSHQLDKIYISKNYGESWALVYDVSSNLSNYVYSMVPINLGNTYWIDTSDEIVSYETDPSKYGVPVCIVSNYVDLDISNEKRVSRVYIDIKSQYGSCGSFSLESDYNKNRYIHTDGESVVPSGSVSMRPWAQPGQQSWLNGGFFDDTVEAWNTNRLDVGVQAQAFRYCVLAGDQENAPHGSMIIRPPMIECQIRGKLNG